MDPSLRIAVKNQMKVDFKLKEIELFILLFVWLDYDYHPE